MEFSTVGVGIVRFGTGIIFDPVNVDGEDSEACDDVKFAVCSNKFEAGFCTAIAGDFIKAARVRASTLSKSSFQFLDPTPSASYFLPRFVLP